jgi:uncharacterized cupin superfamily protein
MKQSLFDDIYAWSVFNETRQIDFNGHLWIRPQGNVLIDPVAMIESDLEQLDSLGGAALIVLTNKDHERQADFFRRRTGASVAVHTADAQALECDADRLLCDGEEIVPGLIAVHLDHGKSPGELALHWPQKKLLLAGDLIVGAPTGAFSLLMDEKLADPPRAAAQIRRLLALPFDAILVGDGHSILRDARQRLLECLEARPDIYFNRINLDEIDWHPQGRDGGFSWQTKDIDPLIGARHLGYQLVRLPPGQSICPTHFHHFGEELFHIQQGTCALLTPRGEFEVRPGDFIAFPPGPAGTHKFINRGTADCIMLALGVNLAHEVCEYPDSGKVNVLALKEKGNQDTPRRIFRLDQAVDYWYGETD